uniref:Uncharacterized protein n=1 Tax=Vespula pensylvanica TaxID=30213 RepID=A0A834KHT7_VESPE|nr:hypothetical protein H0235_014539 [Vespula pensylvanica]
MVDSTSMALARCGRRVNLSGMTISWPLPGFNAPAISMQNRSLVFGALYFAACTTKEEEEGGGGGGEEEEEKEEEEEEEKEEEEEESRDLTHSWLCGPSGALGDAPEGGVALLEEMEEEKGWMARESKRGGWWKVSSAKSAGLKYFRMKTTMSNLARTVSRLNEHDLRADNGERCNRAWSVTKA